LLPGQTFYAQLWKAPEIFEAGTALLATLMGVRREKGARQNLTHHLLKKAILRE
jgi:hypothetical protein